MIKYAVVGLGRVALHHINAIITSKNSQLVAVCDTNEVLAKEYAAKFGDIQAFTSYNELLSSDQVDVVDLCTPSGMHAPMAIQAAEEHKHILVEKPMAMNYADAQKMITTCKEEKVTLAVVLQNRFNKPIIHISRFRPHLGRLNYLAAQVYWYRPQSYYESWRGTSAMDGGVLMNQGTHYVDIALHISSSAVHAVSAFGAVLGHTIESNDTVTMNLQFADGTLGNIQTNTISYPEDLEGSITLFYDKATIKIGGKALNEIIYWKGFGDGSITPELNEQIIDVYGNHHADVINNLSNHLLHKAPLLLTGEEGIKSLLLIEKANESIQKNGALVLC